MIDLITKHRAAVICSVIASLLCVYFLQPILGFFARVFLSVAHILGDAYSNQIYAQAAYLETENYAFHLTVLLYMFTTGIVTGFVITVTKRLLRKRFVADSEPSALDAETDEEGSSRKQSAGDSLRRRVIAAGALTLVAILTVWILLALGADNVELTIISSFKQHMRIVAPFIDDDTEERIISEWSRMSTKEDYDRIQDQLSKIANDNDVELPDNRLYSYIRLH